MSKTSPRTCPECGARLAEAAEVCDLCGLPVEGASAKHAPAAKRAPAAQKGTPAPAEAAPPPPSVAADRPPPPPGAVHCNQCGWRNPPGARFCSMCGERLQELAPASAPPVRPPVATPPPAAPTAAPAAVAAAPAERKAVSRQVGIIVGAGVLLVLALFLVTAVSKSPPDTPTTTQPATPSAIEPGSLPPLPEPLAAQAEALEADIDGLSGEEKIARQRELVSLLFGAGRLDRAALEQQKIAEAQDAPEDWKRAGDLFYDWMVTLEGPRKVEAAQQAIAAYQRVLAVDPDNLDVRTDMATAFLSSNNPMQGVTEIKRVLETDPNHLHAVFNYGIMLSMIGRREQAIEQFEKVKTLVDQDSRYYQQADEAIRLIQQGGSL